MWAYLYLAAITPAAMFVPGYLAIRKTDLSCEAKLTQSVSLSLLFIFAASFISYLCGWSGRVHVAISCAVVLVAAFLIRDILGFLRQEEVRRMLAHCLVCAACAFLLISVTRHYSGGGWGGDWVEHYERSLFFKDHYPTDTKFLGIYSLPSRPPLYNVVASFFLSQGGSDFLAYQLVSFLLNCTVFLGAFLALSVFVGQERTSRSGGMLLLLVLVCLNPSLMENVTYVWTRSLTNFFVICSLALFVMAERGEDPALKLLSYMNMALAVLTHYSACPYFIALLVADLFLSYPKPRALRITVAGVCLFVTLVSVWLAYSVHEYGLKVTLASNTTVSESAAIGGWDNLRKVFVNFFNTLVPHVFRNSFNELMIFMTKDGVRTAHARPILYAREYAFLIYQTNLLFMMGSAGWLLLSARLTAWTKARLLAKDRAYAVCAGLFLGIVLLLGVASVGSVDGFGVGHVCLQPLAILGLAFLASRGDRLRSWQKWGLFAGLMLDGVMGVVIHFWVQRYGFENYEKLTSVSPVSIRVIEGIYDKTVAGYRFIGDVRWSTIFAVCLLTASVVWVLRERRGERSHVAGE